MTGVDPTRGYDGMDASEFFAMIDSMWSAAKSQYLGANEKFVVHRDLVVNTRVLVGGILVCYDLAALIAEKLNRGRRTRVIGAMKTPRLGDVPYGPFIRK